MIRNYRRLKARGLITFNRIDRDIYANIRHFDSEGQEVLPPLEIKINPSSLHDEVVNLQDSITEIQLLIRDIQNIQSPIK